MKKSVIRQEIENILGLVDPHCITDGLKSGVRIKLICRYPEQVLTDQKREKILALPHVTKVGVSSKLSYYSGYRGVTVHFDCSMKDIRLTDKKSKAKVKANEIICNKKSAKSIIVHLLKCTDMEGLYQVNRYVGSAKSIIVYLLDRVSGTKKYVLERVNGSD